MKVNLKRISLIAVTVASSTALWAVARSWLDNPERFSNIIAMLWPALAFVGAGAVIALAFLLMEHWSDRVAATTASWATFIFFWQPNIWYISVLPVFLGFWLLAAHQIRNDLRDRRTMRISVSMGRGIKLILLGSFLMVSLGYYLLPSSQNITVSQVSKDAQQSIQSTYLSLGSDVQIRTQVSQYVDTFIRKGLGPIKDYIPPILAFGLFLILWSFSFLFRGPAVWLGAQLFNLLRYGGFVTIEEQDVKAEILKI